MMCACVCMICVWCFGRYVFDLFMMCVRFVDGVCMMFACVCRICVWCVLDVCMCVVLCVHNLCMVCVCCLHVCV